MGLVRSHVTYDQFKGMGLVRSHVTFITYRNCAIYCDIIVQARDVVLCVGVCRSTTGMAGVEDFLTNMWFTDYRGKW